jgi:hypothetical protein
MLIPEDAFPLADSGDPNLSPSQARAWLGCHDSMLDLRAILANPVLPLLALEDPSLCQDVEHARRRLDGHERWLKARRLAEASPGRRSRRLLAWLTSAWRACRAQRANLLARTHRWAWLAPRRSLAE